MRFLCLAVLLLVSQLDTDFQSTAAGDDDVIDIGKHLELFVDHFLIEKLDNVRLVLNRPRDEGVALRFDEPWEGAFCGYCTVIKDGDLFRLYYRGRSKVGADGSPGEVTCYAESKDGIEWTKPDFKIFNVEGQASNNIVLDDMAPVTHNFCPLLDTRPGVPTDQRFKALGGTMSSGLVALVSADGIHWKKLREEAVITTEMVPYSYMFDSQNLAFWSAHENQYVCYFRVRYNRKLWIGMKKEEAYPRR